MAIQIRVTDSDGSNQIILDTAKSRKVSFAINSDDEGGSFSVAKNHPKAEVLNPDTTGYTKLIEAWDTVTNERLNYGPVASITENGPEWRVTFKGRSAFLNDFIDTRKTFYAAIDNFIDSLRFENIAIQPKTSTLVHDSKTTANQTTVFGSVTVNEKYEGLSRSSKDNVIDGQTRFRPGEIEPPNTYYSVDSFWAGMSKSDSLIVDLGDVFPIDRINLAFPWWGGIERHNNRSYDFTLAYANDTEATVTTLRERDFGPFHTIYNTGVDSSRVDPIFRFNLGITNSGTRFVFADDVALDQQGPVDLRYLRVNISNTHAWYGAQWGIDTVVEDRWSYQCSSTFDGGISENIEINDRTLKPNNDCYASILEISAFKQILERDEIKPLALQRIDNNNLQITYFHVPDASETVTSDGGFRTFEPGGFFRKFKVTYSSAGSTYTKFFTEDCTNCYPDGFNFGITDQNNSLILSRDSSSGTNISVTAPIWTSKIMMKGASDAVVTEVDSWPSKTDPLSWGASYSYTEEANDYAILHFRGQSFKWYATIPADKTGATVKIEIRNKNSSGTWTSWSTLENSYALPNDIFADPVYEITYESGTLVANTIYQIRITNLDGGFCSIDSFEGYWSASMSNYNNDSSRVFHFRPEKMTQIYDGRFSNGSMVKWNSSNFVHFNFEGDRIVLLSAKGRNHGIANVYLYDTDGPNYYGKTASGNVVIPIPGGDGDGGLSVDLDTGKRGAEIPQFVLFDSNDYFTNGLPWGRYTAYVVLKSDNLEEYTANVYDTNNFVNRCEDCKTAKGTQVINKYIYFDSLYAHEKVGLSVSFETQTHLEMVKSVAEAIQVEWEVREQGLRFEPRIGTDTYDILREGHNTLVNWDITNDVENVASMLFSSGADIDGLPLSTIVEDRKNRSTLGRTVMRKHDFRETANYMQLIGLGRMELRKRRIPEKRIRVTHKAENLDLRQGDSFILYTKKQGPIRVRIEHKTINEGDGRTYDLECIRWPVIR